MKNKSVWINILHLYQPPTIEKETLKVVVAESYQPLVKLLKNNPGFKISLNINSCLSYLLYEFGYQKLLEDLSYLINKGQVELLDTAAYHPILPLLTDKEINKQIKINWEMNQGLLKIKKKPQGFWLPECAYSRRTAEIIKNNGYKWIVLDEISYQGGFNKVNYNKKYKIKDLDLTVIFRNRQLSRSYVPDTLIDLINKNALPDIIITATDGEIYGHRHIDFKHNLEKIIKHPKITTKTVSEFLKDLKEEEFCEPIASNWDSEIAELKKNKPYFIWYNKKNKIHMRLWKLARLAYELVEKHEGKEDYWWARLHLEKGMSSCTFWWASDKDFRLFGSPAWKPDEVEKGANELIRAIRSLNIDKKIKIKAEKLYFKLKRQLWLKHWKKQEK